MPGISWYAFPISMQERGLRAIQDGVSLLCHDVAGREAWQGLSVVIVLFFSFYAIEFHRTDKLITIKTQYEDFSRHMISSLYLLIQIVAWAFLIFQKDKKGILKPGFLWENTVNLLADRKNAFDAYNRSIELDNSLTEAIELRDKLSSILDKKNDNKNLEKFSHSTDDLLKVIENKNEDNEKKKIAIYQMSGVNGHRIISPLIELVCSNYSQYSDAVEAALFSRPHFLVEYLKTNSLKLAKKKQGIWQLSLVINHKNITNRPDKDFFQEYVKKLNESLEIAICAKCGNEFRLMDAYVQRYPKDPNKRPYITGNSPYPVKLFCPNCGYWVAYYEDTTQEGLNKY